MIGLAAGYETIPIFTFLEMKEENKYKSTWNFCGKNYIVAKYNSKNQTICIETIKKPTP